MPPQTPLLLVDNVFDAANLYPNATVDAISEAAGREAFRVADYRRDRTWWQPTSDHSATGGWVRTDLGAGATRAVDYLFIDRGHNLWGKTINLEGGDDGAAWPTAQAFTVPASGTVGGDPTWPNIAVTEEGALYSVKAVALTARRWWRFRPSYVAAFVPIVTGVMAGLKTQLLGYSTTFDEDAGERTQTNDTSRAGYRGAQVTYSWRMCELGLTYIGATEYDSTIRTWRRQIFERNQPWVLLMDYGTKPERGWMYQYEGATWGMAKSRVYRGGRIRGREVGPVLP